MQRLTLSILASFILCGFASAFAPTLPAFHRNAAAVVPSSSSTSLGVDIKIKIGEGEPMEAAMRRFKREVNKSGHLMELRHRKHFENAVEKRKRKIKEARLRKRLERMNRQRMNRMANNQA